jgi:hypothetical protein
MRAIVRTTAIVAASALLFPIDALAQATRAGVVTTLQGTATVARAAAPQPAPLKFKDDIFVQDRIVTGERSTVRILLGGKAVITVRERSTLTINETATTATVEVGAGKIALAVAKDRMKPGESVEIKTPNAVAGVRGTVVIAEVSPRTGAGPGGVTSRFTLLTGIVDVVMLDQATGQPSGSPVRLTPLQGIGVTRQLGAVRAISRREAQSIASDYKVSIPTPPPAANTQVMERQLDEAVQHSAALAGSGQNTSQDGTPAKDLTGKNNSQAEIRKTGDNLARGTVSGDRSTGSGGGTSVGDGTVSGGSVGGGPIGGESITGGSITGGSISGGSISGGSISGGSISGGGSIGGGGSRGSGSTGGGAITPIGGILGGVGNIASGGTGTRLGGDDVRKRNSGKNYRDR